MPHTIAAVLMFGLGVQELLIIFAIILVIFGASKLPQLGRGLGEGIRNFKVGLKDDGPESLDESGSEDGDKTR